MSTFKLAFSEHFVINDLYAHLSWVIKLMKHSFFTFFIGVHFLIKTGSALAFFVNEGSKYSNVLEIFSFNKVFKYVNDLERVFFLASISLIYFVLKYVGNLPWFGKIEEDHVQILRILVQNSNQKNKSIGWRSTELHMKFSILNSL